MNTPKHFKVKPVVGQKVYVNVPSGRGPRYNTGLYTVSRVGRLYFEVSECRFWKFRIVDGLQEGASSTTYTARAWDSEEAWDQVEGRLIDWNALRSIFQDGRPPPHWSRARIAALRKLVNTARTWTVFDAAENTPVALCLREKDAHTLLKRLPNVGMVQP